MWETDTNNTNKVLLTGQIRWEPELAETLSSAGCEDISSTARRSRHRIAQGRSEPQSPEQNLPAAWGCGCAPRGESQNTPWQCEPAKSLQSCPTLCNPLDCSLQGFSVHGILQARILEWVAMPSSRGSSQPRDRTHISYVSCTGRWVLYH